MSGVLVTSTEGTEAPQIERGLLDDGLLAVDDVYTLRQEGGIAVHPYAAEAVDEVLLHYRGMVISSIYGCKLLVL